MKRFEGILATGIATAALASGCAAEQSASVEQSPRIRNALENTIKPAAMKMAERAIALSKGENPKFRVHYSEGKTTLLRIVDNPGGGFRIAAVEFLGDESQVNLKNLESVEVEATFCQEVKGKHDCDFGHTYFLYTPESEYEGQNGWQAANSGYIELENEDIPGGYTIDTVDDFEQGKSAIPTAQEIVKKAREEFNSIVAAEF